MSLLKKSKNPINDLALVKQVRDLLNARLEGKTIQYSWQDDDDWSPKTDLKFEFTSWEYRIKPDPIRRPWKVGEAPKLVMVGLKEGGAAQAFDTQGQDQLWLDRLFRDYDLYDSDANRSICGVEEEVSEAPKPKKGEKKIDEEDEEEDDSDTE